MERFLERARSFYNGRYYPILVLLLVFLGHSTEMDLAFGSVMMISLIFGLLISHDVKFTMMPLMATMFIVPIGDFTPSDPGFDRYYQSRATLIFLVALALSVMASIVFFVVRNRKIANRIPVKGVFLSILIFCGVNCLNGLFSPNYTFANFTFSMLLVLSMIVVYLIFAGYLRFEKAVLDYFIYCLVGVGLLICAELIFAYFTTVQFVGGSIVKESVVLGWGVWTNIGNMLVFLMPASFYFAASHKRGWLGYLSGLLHFFCIVLSQSRAALLVGALSLLLCLGYLCLKGRNRKINRIFTLSLIACGAIGCVVLYDTLLALVSNFLEKGFDDNGRMALWQSAIDSFLRAPVLGVGYYDVCSYEGWATFGTPMMCHNTILQILGAVGVLGMLAYGYHRFETLKLFFRKFNTVKFFLGVCILGFLLFGMLDVVFFIGYTNIFYTMMLLFMQYTEYPEKQMYL